MAENRVNNEKRTLLSVRDLEVKFRVRSRILTAIRGISLDIYENEAIAIVGESGSGKSVFTKTFAGMLETNGFISKGELIFDDDELAETKVRLNGVRKKFIGFLKNRLDSSSKYEAGAESYVAYQNEKAAFKHQMTLSEEDEAKIDAQISEAEFQAAELFNHKQTLDPKHERAEIKADTAKFRQYKAEAVRLKNLKKEKIKQNKQAVKSNKELVDAHNRKLAELKAQFTEAYSQPVSDEKKKRNEILAKEIYLSVGRYSFFHRIRHAFGLLIALKKAMKVGTDLSDDEKTSEVFKTVVFRVRYTGEDEKTLYGRCVIDLACVKYSKDWSQIRGDRIATIFQDPMTSLDPIIPIGKQITSIILKHQDCSEAEARKRAIELMKKVGIPNAENRFDDYPFQYSGGMRQRIVIAIALSCQPKILICDEPTTALDVTIQAQILKLLKDLQKEFNYTIVFITHDLGVVANIADRVAVLYAGQIVELGTVEDVFYDPRHPYTWALMSSLPQLAQRNTKLYSITGTPPSLYNKIVGDPFAPRNPYCLKIDTILDSPMFKISDTHYAKTWLLDPRAPKMEKPEIIENIHEKLMKAFNI